MSTTTLHYQSTHVGPDGSNRREGGREGGKGRGTAACTIMIVMLFQTIYTYKIINNNKIKTSS